MAHLAHLFIRNETDYLPTFMPANRENNKYSLLISSQLYNSWEINTPELEIREEW